MATKKRIVTKKYRSVTLYKFTTRNDCTSRTIRVKHLKWGPGVTHRSGNFDQFKRTEFGFIDSAGTSPCLCTADVIHAYRTIQDALNYDYAHGSYLNSKRTRLWKCKGVVVVDDGEKVGCLELTTVERVKIP